MQNESVNRRKNNRKTRNNVAYYTDGNAVRHVEEVPQHRERELSAAARKNRSRNMKMNRGYVIFLAIVCVAALFACVHFLQLKAELTAQKSALNAKELEYSQLKADNDAYYSETVSGVDLDAIREKALGELGMKFPSEDQIKFYTPGGSSYVRQYQDVPEE